MTQGLYTAPRAIADKDHCYFYHTIDIPGVGRIDGNWNLLPNIAVYLGDQDFKNKRVLDVGCANGLLSFYMEQCGAEVVSYDLDQTESWDLVPFAKWSDFDEDIATEWKTHIDRINNAYWFAHGRFNSKAKVVNGSVYEIPAQIGSVDIAVYGSILLHLRDPFLALMKGLRLTRERVIVAELLHDQPVRTTEPYLGFLPDPAKIEPKETWWDIRPEWVVRAIGVLGFEEAKITYHTQLCGGQPTKLYTVVGRRTH